MQVQDSRCKKELIGHRGHRELPGIKSLKKIDSVCSVANFAFTNSSITRRKDNEGLL